MALNPACLHGSGPSMSLHLNPATLTVSHFGSHVLSVSKGPQVVPHLATLKVNVAGHPGGREGATGGPIAASRPPGPPKVQKSGMSLLVRPEGGHAVAA